MSVISSATRRHQRVLRERERASERSRKMIALGVSSPSSSSSVHHVLASLGISPQLHSWRASSFRGIRLEAGVRTATPLSYRSGASGGRMVVNMAKREEEMKEIRAKTTEEINEEVIDLKGELLMLRLQKSARNEFKSSEFGRMRKRVSSSFSLSIIAHLRVSTASSFSFCYSFYFLAD